MSLKKTTAFLEWWATNATGAPAGTDAAEALKEMGEVKRAAVALHRCNATPYTATSERGQMYYPAMATIHAIAKENE